MDGPRQSRVFTVAGTLWSISTPHVRLNSTEVRGARPKLSLPGHGRSRPVHRRARVAIRHCRGHLLSRPVELGFRAPLSATCRRGRLGLVATTGEVIADENEPVSVAPLSPMLLTSGVPLTQGPTCKSLCVDPG
jgi:hypothetical protein